MKKILVAVSSLVLFLGMVQVTGATAVEDEIAARIKKVGEVCIEGQDCAGAAMAASGDAAAAGGAAPKDIYDKSCSTCHANGVAGAPKFGSSGDWGSRIAKGQDVLYQSVFNGLPPGMPAKGLCFTCSDDELKATVDYMVDAAK